MAIPPEVANDALNATLAVVQSLMKRCIKVKKGDPEALKLSDEIARRVTFDTGKRLKTLQWECYIILPTATLICCHCETAKGGAFENVPDWTSVANDNPRIKSHPRFEKTVDYRPPSTSNIPTITTSTDIPATVPIPPALIVLPLTPSTLPSMPSHTDLDIIAKPNPPRVGRPAHPPIRYRHLYMPKAEREKWKVGFPAGDSKKRKVEDEDIDGTTIAKKMRKVKSDVEKEPTGGVIHVKRRELPPVATDKDVLLVADKDFLDAETRPAEWGSDSDVATPWQCDKCAKLDIACLVLPDKKFGYTRLACANCDNMKIACAIDGVGVRQRLQALLVAKGQSESPRRSFQVRLKCSRNTGNHLRPPTSWNQSPPAREILQGIQDLGRRLDLLAANERVDALEVRVGSVETNLLQWLDELEQRLNESDARWKSLESLG
ncbi:uncharacterized protein F5147DRAFT_652160 [Suillus discolor]|uniref:Uncharacterized protein n=1 Tax=Suillus discolor TaxID=1912936 RepID=A0A9P7F9X6_9AGAM|nr:uncharacterized protein F5147DRAFT_652160 [Suillus discolor]KAG2109989.1 hypothetical protein F5147DRAFT_652160 [Suillus discolor]